MLEIRTDLTVGECTLHQFTMVLLTRSEECLHPSHSFKLSHSVFLWWAPKDMCVV